MCNPSQLTHKQNHKTCSQIQSDSGGICLTCTWARVGHQDLFEMPDRKNARKENFRPFCENNLNQNAIPILHKVKIKNLIRIPNLIW
jgi:hypothetical protein